MKWIIEKNENLASKVVARMIVRQIQEKENSNICLPTGSTPMLCLEQLVTVYKNDGINFNQAKFFNMDE